MKPMPRESPEHAKRPDNLDSTQSAEILPLAPPRKTASQEEIEALQSLIVKQKNKMQGLAGNMKRLNTLVAEEKAKIAAIVKRGGKPRASEELAANEAALVKMQNEHEMLQKSIPGMEAEIKSLA